MTTPKRDRSANQARYAATPRGAYAHAKARAKHRGVEFTLTFDQWWRVWTASGRWEQRGNRYGQYNMLRYADAGAYAEGNVYIDTHEANVAERNRVLAGTYDPLQLEGSRVTRITGDECPF